MLFKLGVNADVSVCSLPSLYFPRTVGLERFIGTPVKGLEFLSPKILAVLSFVRFSTPVCPGLHIG